MSGKIGLGYLLDHQGMLTSKAMITNLLDGRIWLVPLQLEALSQANGGIVLARPLPMRFLVPILAFFAEELTIDVLGDLVPITVRKLGP